MWFVGVCPLSDEPNGGIFLFVSNFGAVGNSGVDEPPRLAGLLAVCLCSEDFGGEDRNDCPTTGVLGAGIGPKAVPVLPEGIAGVIFTL